MSGPEFADKVDSFAAAGMSHLQVVLDPIDARSVERLAVFLGRS